MARDDLGVNLANREPNRLILPTTIGAIEASAFNGQWLFLEDYKREGCSRIHMTR